MGSIISKIFGGSKKDSSIGLIELFYDKTAEGASSDDFSQISIIGTSNSPKIGFKETIQPQIPLIGIGGAGVRIADLIAKRLKMYNTTYPVMGIETNEKELMSMTDISDKYLLPSGGNGTGKQYQKGRQLAIDHKEQLSTKVLSYCESITKRYKHEVVFLILGAGGTGVGVGLEVAQLLIKAGKRPVPFLVLPSTMESSRIRFSAAAALYHFTFAPGDRCLKLPTICIDNDIFIDKNAKKYLSSVISAINERIAATLGDLIMSTEVEGHGYATDLNDFLEIFRNIKSIGTLYYFSTTRAEELITQIDTKVGSSTSLLADMFNATRSYFLVSGKQDIISAKLFKDIILKFSNNDVFPKLYEFEAEEDRIELRGISTGYKYTQQIEDLMLFAEDVRVKVLNSELELSKHGQGNPKIDRLDSNEELEVKTGDELSKERSG
ncbi:MAG: hypothetical protein OEZ01_09105 [Candidatus Heimdallarchaeota archaeon]|nr:hypothetical protein [Candidatus Heimdallarchaeota archaeon]